MQIVANKWVAQNARQWPALFVALRGFRKGAVWVLANHLSKAIIIDILYILFIIFI
jgi:hypothetical protein